MPFLVDLVW